MYKDAKVSVIICAAGSGRRFGGDIPKQFIRIGQRTVLETAVSVFFADSRIDRIIVVCPEDYTEYARELLSPYSQRLTVVKGGAERQDSVMNGLLETKEELVLVHDGARPYVTGEVIDRVIETAYEKGSAVPTVRPKDSLRTASGNLDRSLIYLIQTPQGFRREILLDSYERAMKDGFCGTDEGGIIEHSGYEVNMVEGDYGNIKITTKEDLRNTEAITAMEPAACGASARTPAAEPAACTPEVRTGAGFDVHRLVEGRKCILMGVEIPFEKGLLGHSDADVATHALMDALLGAAGMGDIGRLFPDDDPAYEGISSIRLLEEVRDRIYKKGYSIGNADVTVICQRPRIAPHITEMRQKIASCLRIDEEKINIKGTTTERLGFTGRGEGIAAQAVCTLFRQEIKYL